MINYKGRQPAWLMAFLYGKTMNKNKKTQNKKTLTHSDLSQFTGTITYYRNASGLFFTDGVYYLAEHGRAYWLIDIISISQSDSKIDNDPMLQKIQFWKLKVNADNSAQLVCERDRDDVVLSIDIPYTNFPLKEITLYCQEEVLMLPSEY